MNQRIVFGSQEAKAILAKDKELQRLDSLEDEDEPKGDSNELAERLESLDFQIEEMEMELAALEDEAARIRERLKTMPKPDPKSGWAAINKWNAWAKGELKTA